MKIILLLITVMLLMVGAEARYSPGLEIAENENITLDGGQIINFQTTGIYNIQTFGADGSDSTGDGQEIQDAINYTNSAGGGYLFAPPGTYLIDFRSYDANDVVPGNMLRTKSNVHLIGVPGKTIFKVADGMRNSTHSCCILYDFNASRCVENWSIEGITFDGNIAHNDVQTGWTSTYDCIGANNAANYIIRNCVFQNMIGRWAIFNNVGTGTNYVKNNRVIGRWGNLSVVPDWTAIYLSGDDIFADQNLIAPDDEPCNSSTGIELHPTKTGTASGNIIRNTSCGIFLSSDNGNGIRGWIENNRLEISETGIATWNFGGNVIDLVDIEHNTISYIAKLAWVGHGIDISHTHGANNGHTDNAYIHGNDIISIDGSPVWGITSQDCINVTVSGNTVIGPNKGGIVLLNNAALSSKYFTVDHNILKNCGQLPYGLGASIWATLQYNLTQIRIVGNDIQGGAAYAAYVFSDNTPTVDVTIKGNVATGTTGCTAGIVGTKVIQTNGTVF